MLLVVIFVSSISAFAGDWHYGTSSVCSDCHTQHNSTAGSPMRTDNDPSPAANLLLRGTAMELCLSCHDGSKPEAPDVVTPISYVARSAAGSFPNSGGTPTSIAHHLNNGAAEVPPGGTIPMVLLCTTCHDPHGNDNYRNLRPDPTRTGLAPVAVLARQTVKPDGSNPAQVYVPLNVIYKSGVSRWCAQCHGATVTPGHHSVDKPIWGSPSSDYTRWTAVTLPRVPVQSPTDDAIPSTDDQVTCLSCHKAHGSDNGKTLIYADDTTIDSTCEECHDQ